MVTDIGILQPDASGELVLTALHPGRTLDEAKENTGWPLRCGVHMSVTRAPTPDEIRILREDLDPEGIYLK